MVAEDGPQIRTTEDPDLTARTLKVQLAREKELETKAGEEGKRRFLERLRKSPGRSAAATKSWSRYFEQLESKIEKSREKAETQRGRGNRPRWYKAIVKLPPDTLALITLWCIAEKLGRPRDLDDGPTVGAFSARDDKPSERELINEIARTCGLEYFSSRLRSKGSSSGYERWINRARSARERKRRLEWIARQNQGQSSTSTKHWFYLAQILMRHARKVGVIRRRGKRPISVELPTRALGLIESVAAPYYKPMVVKPRQWTSIRGGGYRWVPEVLDFVKHRDNPSIVQALQKAKLGRVYKAVNALQETPWRINRDVYEVASELWRRRRDFPGVPTAADVKGAKEDWRRREQKAESSADDKASGEANDARRRFERLRMKRFLERKLIRDRLEMADQLQSEVNLYFPYQLDFRGRVYPVPRRFNPQSDDMGRALLKFAVGKPIGTRGCFWLAVHVANQWGHRLDKESFRRRRQWVQKNTAQIQRVAANPLSQRSLGWWTEAKKPWRFLASCKEWAQYREKGQDFRSYLPIAMDGTCNGFQHLSAMQLDRRGCAATNVLPNRVPRDIYRDVAESLKSRLKAEARNGQSLARNWLDLKIDRDVVKPVVMITPYGAEQGTKRNELERVVESKQERLRGHVSASMMRKMATYLIEPLEQSIAETCKAHDLVEKWLKSAARTLAGAGIYTLAEQELAKHLKAGRTKCELEAAVWLALGIPRGGKARIKLSAAEQLQETLLSLVVRCLARNARNVDDKRLTKVAAALVGKYICRLVQKASQEILISSSNVMGNDWVRTDIKTRRRVLERAIQLGLYDGKNRRGKRKVKRLAQIIGRDPAVAKDNCMRLAGNLISTLTLCMRTACANPKVGDFARTWLHRDLKELAPRGKAIQWTSAAGFPIVQAEWLYRERSLGSRAYGSSYTDQDTSQRLGIDRNAQVRGIAPNFVHSFDAAHMMLTIGALSEDLKNFAVIHDSYGVHACDVDKLNSALRKTFLQLYRRDVLRTLWLGVGRMNPDVFKAMKPPPRRSTGDMRLEAVLDSEYFFS